MGCELYLLKAVRDGVVHSVLHHIKIPPPPRNSIREESIVGEQNYQGYRPSANAHEL